MRNPVRRILAATTTFLLAGALAGCSAKSQSTAPAPSQPAPAAVEPKPAAPEPKPAPAAAALPGAVAVMVENSPQARPQAGLEQADLVYEMESEGGITRFLAFYFQNQAAKVGPVRSARMAFYDVATAYGAPYAHAGGNYDVLAVLGRNQKSILNVDEIYTAGESFWRTKDRTAPHNLYTSTDLLVKRAKGQQFTLKPLARFAEGDAPPGGKAVSAISFSWGPRTQGVEWTWNGKRWQRSHEGQPHVVESGSRVEADNVVLLFTRFSWDQRAQDGEGQYNVSIVGAGSGYLYRGGQSYAIKWSKPSREEHYNLTMPDGSRVPFAPGQTWVEVLKEKDHVVKGLPG